MKSTPLAVGGIASLLAGACCFGPLVFVTLGIGGTWLANFQLLEPYRPLFIGVALIALAFAWRRIYRPRSECAAGDACAAPRVQRGYKTGFWTVTTVLLVILFFPYFARLFY